MSIFHFLIVFLIARVIGASDDPIHDDDVTIGRGDSASDNEHRVQKLSAERPNSLHSIWVSDLLSTHSSSALQGTEGESQNVVARTEDIRTPERDERRHRGLLLSNGLHVLLVSDPETDKAAASMSVNVGFMHDYEETLGIAHFLEHMLFMGSEKYPDEDHFNRFMSEHAGSDNGETDEDYQTYFFDVSSDHLEEALDITAHMFLKPRLSPSAAGREVNAIDSEMAIHSTSDYFPMDQLERHLGKPGHRYGRFNCGNKKSLETDPQSKGIDICAKLVQLHSEWYSSHMMHLAVLGKESLNDLEEMVVPLFGEVKRKEVSSTVYTEHPWGPEQLNRKVYFVPKTIVRSLSLRFPTASARKYYKNAPMDYLSHLIGHERPGSLFAELRERNWIYSLAAGDEEIPGFAFYTVTIGLTERGMNYIDEIVQLFFQYIHLLRREGVQESTFDELKKLEELQFEFKEKEDPIDYVKDLSTTMVEGYPIKDVLTYTIPQEWNPSMIRAFLEYLTPETMNVFIGTKSFEEDADQLEEWYNTKFRVEMISEDLIKVVWRITRPYNKFYVPPPNEYIAQNFDLYPLDSDESEFPRIIHESKISKFWFKQDDEFDTPKFYVWFTLYSPVACVSEKNNELTELFVHLFGEDFSTRVGYTSRLAGLKWKISVALCGIQIQLHGYTEKLPLFTKMFLSEMTKFEFKEDKFETKKEDLLLNLKNFETKQPNSQAFTHLVYLLYGISYTVDENRTILESARVHDLRRVVKQFFSRLFIRGLVYGNCDEELARDVISTIENAFTLKSVVLAQEILLPRVAVLEDATNFTYEATHKYSTESSNLAYFQLGPNYPTRNVVISDLFAEIAADKCFKTLRTDEQLGYEVNCFSRNDYGIESFVVLVQSDMNPVYVRSRVEAFLRQLHQKLKEMSPEEYETSKTSLRDRYLEKILGQKERCTIFWSEITSRRYHFGRDEERATILDSVYKEDIIEFFENYMLEPSGERRKLDIFVTSEVTKPLLPEGTPVTETIKIEDAEAFKSGRALFPHEVRHEEVAPIGAPVHLYAAQ